MNTVENTRHILRKGVMGLKDLRRFLDKTVILKTDTMDSCCWQWIAATSGKKTFPYGAFKLRGKKYDTHRLAYRMFVGPVKRDEWVAHECGNSRCVNPRHLFKTTRDESMTESYNNGTVKFPWQKASLASEK